VDSICWLMVVPVDFAAGKEVTCDASSCQMRFSLVVVSPLPVHRVPPGVMHAVPLSFYAHMQLLLKAMILLVSKLFYVAVLLNSSWLSDFFELFLRRAPISLDAEC
jgi:hypothetical protein